VSSGRWGRALLEIGTILLVGMTAYAASLQGYFLSDDFHLVTFLNPDRTSIDWGNVVADFSRVYRGDPSHSYYRPLITLSGALDYALWGLNPFGAHLTNVLINAVNGLLVYGIAGALPPSLAGPGLGLLAGLLFTLHPLHPEAVYWLVGRTELMVACFVLLAILLYVRGVDRDRPAWRWLSLLAFLLALTSKETAVVVPVALTLWHVFAGRPGATSGPSPRARHLVPHYLMLVGYLVVRKAVIGQVIGQYGQTGIDIFAPRAVPTGLLHLIAYQLYPVGESLLAPNGEAAIGPVFRKLVGPIALTLIVAVIAAVIEARHGRRTWFFLGLMLSFALPSLAVLAEGGTPEGAPRLFYLPSSAYCLWLAALLGAVPAALRRLLGTIIVCCFAALLVASSLPWIQAGRLTRDIVQQIEQAANRPSVEEVVLLGHPDFHFGAELFGTKSWALPVAAAAPFARIPTGVRIVGPSGEPCSRVRDGRLRAEPPIVVLRWDASRQRLDRVPWSRLVEFCAPSRQPSRSRAR